MLDTGKRERKAVNYLAPGVSSAELRGHGGGGSHGGGADDDRRAARLPKHLRLPRMDEWQFHARARLTELHALEEELWARARADVDACEHEERRAQRREERGAPAVVRRGAENTAYAVLPPADSLSLGLAPSQSGLREFLDAQLYGDRVPRVAGATLAALRKQRPAANFATAAPPAAAARSAAGAKRRRQRERRAQQPKAPKVVDLAAATSLDRRAAKMKRDAAAGRSSRKYG